MKVTEALRLALTALVQNRMRALLTTLGIVIGVGAVITLITLGQGVEGYVRNQFQALGTNLLVVTSKPPENGNRTRIEPLTNLDVERLRRPDIAPSVAQVGGQLSTAVFACAEGETLRTSARGVTPNIADMLNWNTKIGRFITQEDEDGYARVAVVGEEVVEQLYGSVDFDPTGTLIRLNNLPFTIIGVMASRGAELTNDNVTIFVPISTAQTRLANARYRNTQTLSTIYVQAASEDHVGTAQEEVRLHFDGEHDTRTEDDRDFTITNRAGLLDTVGQVMAVLTVFLGLIASVSLLVGGIGIMNIMLVAVTERTQEIGLRKAVGAQPNDILLQFLFESIVLSLAGGAFGVLLGVALIKLSGALVPDLTMSLSATAIAPATLVSITIGLVFGLYPARRAARMNPIDALRYE